MLSKQVKPKTKAIDANALIYHHFEYSVSHFGLFDDADDGTPVVIGSRNLVDATIRNLSSSVTIYYYKKNKLGYWEKKLSFVGKKQSNKIALPQEKREF